MKHIYSTLLFLMISILCFGQRDYSYMPSKRNFKVKYVNYDHKNRKVYTEIWQLAGKSKDESGKIRYNIESEITTVKQNTFYQYFHFTSKDSNFYIGAERYLDPIKLDSYQKMVVKIDADRVVLPIKPIPGKILPEASCQADILRGTGSVLMSMTVLLVNRKVDGVESIETPAGKFKCYKISSDKIYFSGISRNKTKLVEWYAINVGLIRMEEYHKKGKLIFYKQIESIAEDFFIP
ncbi:hypothetical protein [Marinifilum flexuosum]|uniref:TapB family protein n=1 Tax=Marinifilum flexuosum TaxID=1117708 RepID=UPI00248FD32C|nr:hypothetical protein [Marinifilum flexuosum]